MHTSDIEAAPLETAAHKLPWMSGRFAGTVKSATSLCVRAAQPLACALLDVLGPKRGGGAMNVTFFAGLHHVAPA